jgi:hypothetical protein
MRRLVSSTLTNGATYFAVYPGGIEVFAGPFGLRAEVGEDIYFNSGAHNNLRVRSAVSFLTFPHGKVAWRALQPPGISLGALTKPSLELRPLSKTPSGLRN